MTPDPVIPLERDIAASLTGAGFEPETIARIDPDSLRIWTREAAVAGAPVIFLSAGIHGDEGCGTIALRHLFRESPISDRFHWVVAPLLNPSGLRLGTRENRHGIDLNRDFLRRRGEETRALMDWWSRQTRGCDLHLSFHEDWEAEGFYLYEINTGPLPSLAHRILEPVSRAVSLQTTGPVDDHELTAPGLIIHAPEPDEQEGWPEAIWITRHWPVLSYTFEAPGRLSAATRTTALRLACESAIQAAGDLNSSTPPSGFPTEELEYST